jgi:hypothetical protein
MGVRPVTPAVEEGSAGEVKSRGGAALVQLAVTPDRGARVEGLDRDAAALELLYHRGGRLQAAVVPAPEDQALRELLDHLVQILDRERMALPAPPIGDDTVRQDDEVAGLLLAVDHYPAEAVVLESRHRYSTIQATDRPF